MLAEDLTDQFRRVDMWASDYVGRGMTEVDLRNFASKAKVFIVLLIVLNLPSLDWKQACYFC